MSDLLGRRLLDLREKRGYTQLEISDMLHLSKSSISHYEKGINVPPMDTLIELARIYEVSLDYLAGDTPIPNRYYSDVKYSNTHMGELIIDIVDLDKTKINRIRDYVKILKAYPGALKE